MNIRNRIIEYKTVEACELRPNPKNWRVHPKAQQDALRGVLAEVGIADAVLARKLPDGSLMLIDGHLRAETLGDGDVPVLILDVNEAEADKLLATLDPLAAMAEKDAEQLASLLADLKQHDDTLASLVWPDYVIDPLLSASWTPPEIEADDPAPQNDDGSSKKNTTVTFLAHQSDTVRSAIDRVKKDNECREATDSDCLVLVCQWYLDK